MASDLHDPDAPLLTRRRFGIIAGGTIASLAFASACEGLTAPRQASDGRLSQRPKAGAKTTAPSGKQPLGLGGERDGVLQIPPNPGTAPLPLLILLHGAGGSGENQLGRFGSAPDDAGVAVLAPDSRDVSWDAIGLRGQFGPDIAFLNRALARVFETVAVDPARLTIGGFSDGATYALSLGLINGTLFPRVAAFSPGYIVPGAKQGRPRFFISHGTADPVLPIDRCGRVIAKDLKDGGYDVTYKEFAGGHQVPMAIAVEGFGWIAKKA